MANTQIQRCLKGFKYLRSDIEVEILITANKNVFGALLVSSLPFQPYGSPVMNVTRQLQAEPHLLDISKQEALKMHLPYINTQRFYRLTSPQYPRQWKVHIEPLCLDTLTVDTTPGFDMEIWASLVDPQLSLLTDADFQSLAYRPRLHQFAQAVSNLGTIVPFAASNAMGNFMSDMQMPSAATAATAGALGGATMSAASVAGAAFKAYQRSGQANNSCSPIKQQLCPDLNGAGVTSLSFLGNRMRGDKDDLPDIRNRYDIRDICATPAYLGTFGMSLVTDVQRFSLDPALIGSYFSYFSRMFRYYRCDTKVMFRFTTSPDVVAKFYVKLEPSGFDGAGLGDVPFWEVSTKGTQDFSVVVPYMELFHWLETYQSPQSFMKVGLMRDLDNIYDKRSKIFVSVFLAPVNLSFGAQQSPCNATLQCTFEEAFSSPESFGTSYCSRSMDGPHDVPSLLTRFSSRTSDGLPIFPFPKRINSAMYDYDTYDYVAQLYAFYTGSVDVKYMAGGVTPPGLLKIAVGNNNLESTNGNTFKAGNSLQLTSQAAYPLLEVNFPYERPWEFDSIDAPLPAYIPEINYPDSITEVFLRPGEDFSFFTLLPTPLFADNFNAVFQSYIPRVTGVSHMGDFNTCDSGGRVIDVPTSFGLAGATFVATMTVSAIVSSAHIKVPLLVNLTQSDGLATFSSQLSQPSVLRMPLLLTSDTTTSGRNTQTWTVEATVSNLPGPFYLHMVTSVGLAELIWSISFRAFGTTAISLTQESLFVQGSPPNPISTSQTGEVTLAQPVWVSNFPQ